MAQKITVQLVDDMDGTEATQSVTFGLDGVTYEIDLNDSHADELRASVDKFLAAGRRIGGRSHHRPSGKTVKPSPKASAVKADNGSAVQADGKTIRAWATANGVPVPMRGRIPRAVVAQFEAANPL